MKKKNEVHVSKLITEMPKLDMTHNARLVLYSVLKKSWQSFRNREDYISKDILTEKDYKIAQEPVTLGLSDLKPLFRKNTKFQDIKDHILTIPYEARFKTNIDSYGRKRNELLEVKIALFKKVEVSNNSKEITFTPAEYLLDYIEALKTFAKIDIEEIKNLNSLYAIRAYEFICQNNYLDKNNTKLVSDEIRKVKIEDFRRYFEIPDTYTIANIVQKVFTPIKRLINKHTKYNIVDIKRLKFNPNNKCKVSHIRIDVEYKEEYLKMLKEKSNQLIGSNTKSNKDNINNQDNDNTNNITTQDFFDKVWSLYPLKKGKADIEINDMMKLQELGYEKIKICIERYKDYIKEKEKESFNQSFQGGYKFFTKGYIDYLDENYTPYKAKTQKTNKPEQATNFEQREYDDEFFEDCYDNFRPEFLEKYENEED